MGNLVSFTEMCSRYDYVKFNIKLNCIDGFSCIKNLFLVKYSKIMILL